MNFKPLNSFKLGTAIFFWLLPVFLARVANADEFGAYNFHAQTTYLTQGHSTFNALYSGNNSLLSSENAQTSETLTFALGVSLGTAGEFYIDPELTGGSGLSKTLGVAGYPNGEIYRVDNPTPVWNVARFFWKKVLGQGGEQEVVTDQMNQLAKSYDLNRSTLILGKFALNDFFDENSLSHDPRTQFMNWTLMDFGAWDYAADTKGYSWGIYLEYNRKNWTMRFASVLEPAMANQMNLDMNVGQAHGDNLEFEYRYSYYLQPGVVRVLLYDNHAYMGNYQQAMIQNPIGPVVSSTRQYDQKFGFGVNVEQKINPDLGVFSRLSWNNGQTESWAFAEIDQSASLGMVFRPRWVSKFEDTLGVAAMVNGLSDDHKNYLQAGGYGFMIGDGQLNYAYEKILETYYLLQFTKEAAVSFDIQTISCPAYNADRGPVSVFGLRLHYEI